MLKLRVADESEMPVADYDSPAQFGAKEFYDFRNHVIQVLRRFGSAGPMGTADLSTIDDDDPSFEEEVVENPDFFVVDDVWNEHDKLSLVESDFRLITVELIKALAEMAGAFTGWRVVLKLGDCGLDVFGDKVIAGGRRFWDCSNVGELALRCAAPIDYGPVMPFSETMYPLWSAVVSGEFKSSAAFAAPPDRQWKEAIRALDRFGLKAPGKALSSFAYDRIRLDLHPHTRHQFVHRFLTDISSYARTSVKEARSNILRDAAHAFSASPDASDRELLARTISGAQKSVATWSEPNDVVFWWPHVLSASGEPDGGLRPILATELRSLLSESNSWIQLSAVFGLALLRADDIAAVVDQALAKNPAWAKKRKLRAWLGELSGGSTTYPSLKLS